jgi:hypothetical protein
MKNPVYEKDDLKSELIIFYLERYKTNISKNQWFVMMKNFMLDKYKHLIVERKHLNKLQTQYPTDLEDDKFIEQE